MATGVGRRLHCGDGLYLCRNGKPGANRFTWARIYMKDGKRREAGLGPYTNDHRDRTASWVTSWYDEILSDGKDLIEELRAEKKKVADTKGKTFAEVAELYVKDVGARTWKGGEGSTTGVEFKRVVRVYCRTIAEMD